jgi:hypothetical protein
MKTDICFGLILLLGLAMILPAIEVATSATQPYPTIRVTGFGRVRYTYDFADGKISGFSIAQARFGVTGAISEFFNYTFSVETTNTATENRKMVCDVYIDATIIPGFRIRAGQFKYPFGLEQSTPDADLEFVNKADVVTGLVNPTRDIGLQVARDFSLGPVATTLSVALLNGSGSNLEDENNRKTLLGRFLVTPLTGLTLGGSYYSGTTGVANDVKDRWGIELKYEYWRLFVKSEYMFGKDKTIGKDGYYVMAGYSIIPSGLALIRFDRWNPDRDAAADKSTSRWTFGFNYFFGRNIIWRTNYEFRRETPAVQNDLFMTQFQVKF